MERVSGIRKFSEAEIEALRVIEVSEKRPAWRSRTFGSSWTGVQKGRLPTRSERRCLRRSGRNMEAELEQMNRTLDMLKFKCWYYEQAIKDGSEDAIPAMIPNDLPEEAIRRAYENSHKE